MKSSYIRPLVESIPNARVPPTGQLPYPDFRRAQRTVEAAVVSIRASSSEILTETPPLPPPPGQKRLVVSYSGNDGVNIRDSRIISSKSNLHGALFQQTSIPLIQLGDSYHEGSREWIRIEVKGWVPEKNKSKVFLTSLGDGTWKVDKSSDGFVAMRTGTASTYPLVCNLAFATVIKEVNRDFSDPVYQ